MKLATQFFATARERYEIHRRRRDFAVPTFGKDDSSHWTQDPVFQQWRFCNVHREMDRTTVWFKENIRDPLNAAALDQTPARLFDLVMGVIIFRWFNRISTGEIIKDLILDGWDRKEAQRRLGNAPGAILTGAYMVRTPFGMTKLEGVLSYVEHAGMELTRNPTFLRWGHSLHEAHEDLLVLPGMGRFTSYEVVTDLRHTCLLGGAEDIMTWASAGPGCARGLGWVMNEEPQLFNYTSRQDQSEMNLLMYNLLMMSRQEEYWPQYWTPWEMREVEHWACEFDKYKRAEKGDRLKRRFP